MPVTQKIAKSETDIIFIGEKHYDFSYVTLLHDLLKSCDEKGLTVAVFSEYASQAEKIEHERDGGIENEPQNSAQILASVDRVLSEQNKFLGYFEHYHEKQEKVRLSTRTDHEQKIAEEVLREGEHQRESIKEKYLGEWLKIQKEQIMRPRDAEYAAAIKTTLTNENYDVAIILTGGAHVRPITENLELTKQDFVLISNQQPRGIDQLDAVKFEVNQTQQITIPQTVEQNLKQKSANKKAIEASLQNIASDENFHGIAVVSRHNAVTNIAGISTQTPFPIHSVGKMLTGLMMMEMVSQGIIDETDLTKIGIKLPEEITEKLSGQPQILDRLSQVSLLQTMTHKAGLGDYLGAYTNHVRDGGQAAESMNELIDFVKDEQIETEFGKYSYSNNGFLLGGLALQELYRERTGRNLSYEKILDELVIQPSQTNISMTRPADIHYKEEDREHLSKFPASPAGGHFASIEDFLKLGQYLQRRCQDSNFMELVKKYGTEFYNEKRNLIRHLGDVEGATPEAAGSGAGFGVFLHSGKTIAIFTDRDASENDRTFKRLEQTHVATFFEALRDQVYAQQVQPSITSAKIAIITPGCRGDVAGSTIAQDAGKLKSLGFNVAFDANDISPNFPFIGAEIANTAEARAKQIINYAQDPQITAMWAVHGGESCPEVAALLVEYGKNPQQYLADHQVDRISGETLEYVLGAENGFPKDRALPTIVGMSDVSNIQLALAGFGFPSHYGSVTLQNVDYLQKMSRSLQEKNTAQFDQIIAPANAPEKIEGVVYATVSGGLESSLYTDWQPKFPPNTVLMIEGVSGYEAISKTLQEAKNAGALQNVSAILVGNAVNGSSTASEESIAAFKKFAGKFQTPILAVTGDQFGHLKDKEPTPIANFGNITIDTKQGTATIEQDLVRENIAQFYAGKTIPPKSRIIATNLESAPPAIELTAANGHEVPQQLRNVIGCSGAKLPAHLDLAGETLVVGYSNWVNVGRQLTDLANRGELEGISAIVIAVENQYPQLKEKFDQAQNVEEKVAVGLSFLTHPDFRFSPAGENLYACNTRGMGVDPNKFGENSFVPWLAAYGIKLGAIAVEGDVITLEIPHGKKSFIIEKTSDPVCIGRVEQCQRRAEYFAKQHPEIPVFITNRNQLPKEMKGDLFYAESLSTSHQEEPGQSFALRFPSKKTVETEGSIGEEFSPAPQKPWAEKVRDLSAQKGDASITK